MENLEIKVVDMHTAGEAARIIMGGLPEIKGNTMYEKREYIRKNYDYIRTSLMLEPRGHKDMFGAFLLEPCNPEADFGALFCFGSDFEDMCGHASIAICTMLVDRKMVEVTEPVTTIKLDTVAGLVEVSVNVKDGKTQSVTFANVPSFVYKRDFKVPTDSFGEVNVDMIYAGIVFSMINAEGIIDIVPENANEIIKLGMEVRKHLPEVVKFVHPEQGELPMATAAVYSKDKSVTIFGDGQLDRSPCGTGTGARAVLLHEQGKLAVGEEWKQHSIVDSELTGKIVSESKVGEYTAYTTEITGIGTIYADVEFYINEEDPLYKGFVLG